MPATQRSLQSTASGKKQQTISSFFTKNSSPVVTSSPNGALPHQSSDRVKLQEQSTAASADQPDDDIPVSPISTFRAEKRGLASGDKLPAESDDSAVVLPSRKRLKRANFTGVQEDGGSSPSSAKGSHCSGGQDDEGLSFSSKDANKLAKSTVTERTSRFLFSSSHGRDDETVSDTDKARQQKDRLHQDFVKKLGEPDSIGRIKRRNWQIEKEIVDAELAGEGDQDEEEPQESTARKAKRGVKKGGSKLTPLEKQVLEIKRENPDTLLVIEVGYKFRFFGEDARVAAKELSIVCIPGKLRYDEHPSETHLERFASASIPVHRLHVHVKRLVAAGHKVGVVRQLETAALKAAGDNRNAPFVRSLTNVYTKGTYIDDVEDIGEAMNENTVAAQATGYLLCITETRSKGWGTDENVHVGILAVQPLTGDVIYDSFEDGFMRSEIETRLLHMAPCELLIVGELTKASEKLVQHLSGSKTNVFGDKVRLERVDKPKTMAAQASSHVTNFYAEMLKAFDQDKDTKACALLEKVLSLPDSVTICLSAMITHLTEYGLEHVFKLTKYFQSFSARSHMLLNGTALASLEIYQNQTDHSEKGSLFWTLDRTKTRFGHRLLRKWVGRPLLDKAKLEARVTAVQELKEGEQTTRVEKVRHVVWNIKSDLEKSLIRIYYGKCTRFELMTVLQSMQRIANEFSDVKQPPDAGFKSSIINEAIVLLPVILDDVVSYLEKINCQAAKEDDKYNFFQQDEETDTIVEHKLGIVAVEHELNEHRKVAAQKLKKANINYVTVSAIEYLIEVDNHDLKLVPASWIKISGTKKLSRFHTPEVLRLIRERDQHKEALAAACDSAFRDLLTDIAQRYQKFRDSVQALATLDCLLSLATVASQQGYTKPEFTDEVRINVRGGRHPMVEQLLLDAYVPNDIDLASNHTRALLVTGPNMGGKSSYVRQIALIAIMGQIGSYVPAESAELGMLDAVFARMGAFDNIMAGESTFMVELSETSDILKQASPRSLIILDELGRGTSTHDGVAIARAVLDYVVRDIKSLTLFITHYQSLSTMAKSFSKEELKNVHMKFTEIGENGQEITFLYEVGAGVAYRSYGLNVARLATLPESVLQVAAVKSKELEHTAVAKSLSSVAQIIGQVLATPNTPQLEQLIFDIEQF